MLYKNGSGELPRSTHNLTVFLCGILVVPILFIYEPAAIETVETPAPPTSIKSPVLRSSLARSRMLTISAHGISIKDTLKSSLKSSRMSPSTQNPDSLESSEKVTYVRERFRYFYFYSLPIVKFWMSTFLYLCFVALCSVTLVDEAPFKYEIPVREHVLFVWTFSLTLEELYQLISDKPKQYFKRWSNRMDTAMLLFFFIFILLRIAARLTHHPTLLYSATCFFVLATICAYLRLMHVFSLSNELGPLYFVIIRLTWDVMHWLFIFVIFCFGIQVAIMAFVKQVGNDPWLPITAGGSFGVSFFTIIGDYSDAFPALEGSTIGIMVLVIYALIAQIVLVNLLIAMMGDTYSDVKTNSLKEWKFNRYSLATEFGSSSSTSPPFNLILLPYIMFRRLYNRIVENRIDKDNRKSRSGDEEDKVEGRRLKAVMRSIVQELSKKEELEDGDSTEGIDDEPGNPEKKGQAGAPSFEMMQKLFRSEISRLRKMITRSRRKRIPKPTVGPSTRTKKIPAKGKYSLFKM